MNWTGVNQELQGDTKFSVTNLAYTKLPERNGYTIRPTTNNLQLLSMDNSGNLYTNAIPSIKNLDNSAFTNVVYGRIPFSTNGAGEILYINVYTNEP